MMSFSFMSIKNAVQQSGQNGQFEFCGVDILLDSDLSPYLLEINVNPALFTDNNSLKQILPQKIESLLNLEVKVHKNIQECEKVVREMKDKSFDDFEVIINESIEYIFK